MKKLSSILLILLGLSMSSCEDFWGTNTCDCEYVIYNYTNNEWVETERCPMDQDSICWDEIIVLTEILDTIGVYVLTDSTLFYETNLTPVYKEEVDCPMYYN